MPRQHRTIITLLLVATLTAATTGCDLFWTPTPAKPLLVRQLVDTSAGSGIWPYGVTSLVDTYLPEVIQRRGSVEYFRLDDTEGAVLVGRFTTGKPSRDSKSGIAAFERDQLLDAKRSFLGLRDNLFGARPKTSPLALALTVMSSNQPKNTEVRYYLSSDAREWSPSLGVDMECHPPTPDRWASVLRTNGLLPQGSLNGAQVAFVGVRPMMSVPGDRCTATLPLMNQTRLLWEAAITNAGGKVSFARDKDDLQNIAVLLFFSGGILAMRKRAVKKRALQDRKEGRYSFMTILLEILGPKPGLDPDHPEHQEALRRIDFLRSFTDELRVRLRDLREELARHMTWWVLFLGAIGSTITEAIAWIVLFRNAGIPAPDLYLLGVMTGVFFIVLIMFTVKHAQTTGNKTWFWICVSVVLVIAIAVTTVRVKDAMTNGGELIEEVAIGVVLLAASLGPALLTEYLLRPLRLVLPIVKLVWELKKQLREALYELQRVTKRLSREAELRRAWEWESQVLQGTYDGINPPPPPNNLQGGITWPDSASSSIASRS